jgi:hypothetical protein
MKAASFKKERNIQISTEFREGSTVDRIPAALLHILAWRAYRADGTRPREPHRDIHVIQQGEHTGCREK